MSVRKIFLLVVSIVVGLPALAIFGIMYARRIRPHTVLVVRIEGEIPEQTSQNSLQDLFSGESTSVTDITEGIERARTDPRITTLELRVGENSMSMGKIQEVRDRIRAFNRSRKLSVGYLEFATNRSYYLASACQTLVMLPRSEFHLHGMMASSTFLRGAFDKLGIYPDFLHIGDFKNATNTYTEKKFTAPHREATKALVDDWFRQFVQGVADSRNMKPDEVAKLVASGRIIPMTLRRQGLWTGWRMVRKSATSLTKRIRATTGAWDCTNTSTGRRNLPPTKSR